MAKASTEKRTKLEPSEIFAVVGMLMKTKDMQNLCIEQSGQSILSWLSEGKKLAQSDAVKYGSSKEKYLSFFNQPTPGKKTVDLISNVVAGFSAAIGVKKFIQKMDSKPDFVAPALYMTGATWPKKVNKFRMVREADNFDYNSSDIVVEIDDETYYGISLKKKKNVKGADPTLINKAFDTLLQGQTFEKVREQLREIRQIYFANVVKKAVEQGIINVDLKGLSNQQIWNLSFRNPLKNNELTYIINLKGTNKNNMPVQLSEVKGSIKGTGPNSLFAEDKVNGMRAFVNKELYGIDNELFNAFKEVLEDNIEMFSEGLVDTVLKTKMQSGLRAKGIDGMDFEFALVTGYADYTGGKNPKLRLNPAKVLPQHTILCGLANLEGNNKPYKLEVDKDKKEKANAAKVFFNLSKDKVNILELELRYKGDFKAQPQFFATLSDGFITQMQDECLIQKSK